MSQLTPKRDVTTGKILSHIRGAWYVEYPEELVVHFGEPGEIGAAVIHGMARPD
ncbi:MAG: hypothetical protein WCF18_20825 [Chthoniobacteraceae bacterium]